MDRISIIENIRTNNKLLSLPQVLSEVLKEVGKEDSSPDSLARIILKDPSLTGRVLRLSNSSFYHRFSDIKTVNQAVSVLGVTTVKCLALSSSIFRRFGSRKSAVHSDCRSCNFFDLCLGDCLKYRNKNGGQTTGISHLCTGWQEFFHHSRQSFVSLAKKIRHDQIAQAFGHQPAFPNIKASSIGRNQPCPCGSGKKFKKCCGR